MLKKHEDTFVKEDSKNLPNVNYLWIGPPKIDTSGENKLGADVEDVIEVSRRCPNKIYYYCLDEHVQHYHDLFKKHDCTVEVKSIDQFIAAMQNNEDPYIREKANKMSEVRRELLAEPRNRIVDRVAFKDAFSLFLLATEGGYALDASVRLADNTTHFTFPLEDNFKAPVGQEYESWMLYASPTKLDQPRVALDSYLSKWDSVQQIIRENVDDIHRISKFHQNNASLIIDSITKALHSIPSNNLNKWRFQFDKTNTSLAKVNGFPLIKIYRNSHKPHLEIREIILKRITEYLKQAREDQENRNELISHLEKELHNLRNTDGDDHRKMVMLNDKLHQVFEALKELDRCFEKLPKDNSKISDHVDKGYHQLKNCLQEKPQLSDENPQMIMDQFRENIRKISPDVKKQLDNILLAKAHEDLSSKRDLNHIDENGMSLIHLAVLSEKPAMIKALLQKKADPDILDNAGKSPLHLAVKSGSPDLVRALLPKINGANPNVLDGDGLPPLHYAIQLKQHKIVGFLLRRDANPDMQDKQGLTALHHAINSGDMPLFNLIIDALIKEGRGLNTPDQNGLPPLVYALRKGNRDMIEALLKKGANTNFEDKSNLTIFHHAIKSNHTELLKTFVEFGADPNRAGKGISPLHYAVFFGTASSVESLLDLGADPNIRGKDNRTPLHLAASQGKKEVAELLVRRGAKIDVLDNNKKSPLEYANSKGFLSIAEMLIKFQEQKTEISEPEKSKDTSAVFLPSVSQSQQGFFDHSKEHISTNPIQEFKFGEEPKK
ncbi:ankyrin repeat domain-containing protein [Legionella cherrii]|uniref:Ankyrin repeat-containing protein n=1 Tax=Legionella cherrii TaxID=28084 RepID=A0ABY6T3Q0_9GAMM|nr:ankyrin repeat domain-containing protein [Legionella cherrii]VEB33637.1 ankyrin repeat-containing protein [Legionella cherrii]